MAHPRPSAGDGSIRPLTNPSEAEEIYCVKCKAKTPSRDIAAVTMQNGRPAARAICTECGARKSRIGVLGRDNRPRGDPVPRYFAG